METPRTPGFHLYEVSTKEVHYRSWLSIGEKLKVWCAANHLSFLCYLGRAYVQSQLNLYQTMRCFAAVRNICHKLIALYVVLASSIRPLALSPSIDVKGPERLSPRVAPSGANNHDSQVPGAELTTKKIGTAIHTSSDAPTLRNVTGIVRRRQRSRSLVLWITSRLSTLLRPGQRDLCTFASRGP